MNAWFGMMLASSLISGGVPGPAPHASPHPPADVPGLVARIQVLSELFPTMSLCHWSKSPDETAFTYVDWHGIVRHIVTKDGKLHVNWKSFPLESRVRELLTDDLDGDGNHEIIAYTTDSRIYVWTTIGYQLLWDSTGENLGTIQALVIGNVDVDRARELILCSDNRLVIYDGIEFFRQKEGRDRIDPVSMVFGDVDGDGVAEIVTNDGHVIDSQTLTIEWSTEPLGYPIRLFDIDDDGIPEVVGERNRTLKFWNMRDRRELW